MVETSFEGHQKIWVKTWGCSHNSSDSEYMAGMLTAAGYPLVNDKFEAQLWLLNSCTVKSPSEEHLKNTINKALEEGRKVVVAGCVSQADPKAEFLSGLSVIGVHQTDRVVEVVEETLKGNSVRLLGTKSIKGRKLGGSYLDLPKIRRNPFVEILAINTGCLNHCTYCKTKMARGNLGSYPIEEIVERCRQSFREGVKEIWMTSEDTGAYGRDIGVTLPDLLRQVIKEIPEGCRLRLGMTNPPYIMDHLEEIAEILLHPRVYSFLHVPVQSGSDPVLKEMRREYTRVQFCQLVDYLRKHVPGITIATDIICGFPTETEQDFDETMSLCAKYGFPTLYINQFYPRPGTPAARMKRIPTDIVKNRTRRLTQLFDTVLPYENRVGREYDVLVTEIAADKKHFVGHNKFYEQILVPARDEYMGANLRVKVVETGKHFMKADVIIMIRPAERIPTVSVQMIIPVVIVCTLVALITVKVLIQR
ncbi:threonylcarbamoyladenosine tRNA methylthiotransferase-like isoform X2 [Varroa jacobsoni]|uniref:tRNA-t(6)A37 methylthiotransferase n=1 Tax=Varroa destructor TaxID=109461 RepID=A0A7M7MB97_VARDE|nr:threonylcarbamoyladenosine tRNA methylthiotransferase-like isoform X3 [Varroa destructor]XP_022696855.1 threonylcarbamoyladenosine tRNA methylthiotransferase-like isoform X2 [Varroa jacobsoni]